MQEFLIGRSHRESIVIPESSHAVSHEHAKITIYDDGVWVVEALAQNKPLYIQQPDGQLLQIGRKRITPDTVLVLGAPNAAGFKFYARNVLGQQKDPKKFKSEFLALQSELETILADEKAFKQKSKVWDKVRMFGPALAFALCMVITFVFKDAIPEDATETQRAAIEMSNKNLELNAYRALMMIVPIGLSILVGFIIGDRDRFSERRKRLRCPNPQCGCRLGEDEIFNGKCPRCQSHI